ncbi:MAG: signal recognition particle-docking protein FtsY [Kaiparowitsia implicata GSE-PSE-MK54-09C]|jgi:fused signal recognition particle receptor|nr:signal recognition particle-docking protein FtsY [Kaiparowitsia implicata GSE-PSE-MK54-09C]
MTFNWFNRQAADDDAAKQAAKEAEQSKAADSADKADDAAIATPEDYLTWAKAAYQNIQKQKVSATAAETAPEPTVGIQLEAEPDVSADVSTEPIADPALSSASTSSLTTSSPTIVVETPQLQEVDPQEVDPQPMTATPSDVPPTETLPSSKPQPLSTTSPESTLASDVDEAMSAEPSVVELASPPVAESGSSGAAPAGSSAPTDAPEPLPAASEAAEAEPVLPLWARAEAERQERLERLKAEAEAAEPVAPEPVSADVAPEEELDESFLWSARVLAAQGRRPDEVNVEEITWLKRLRQGLDKTRRSLINQLKSIVGQGPLNQEAVMEIEALLLQADVGVDATDTIIDALQAKLREEALPPEEAIAYLKKILRELLDNPGGKPYDPTFAPEKDTLNIWLMTGVNGAGKTTTIGKIAHIATQSGYRTLIGAADTFRAAAVQQVKVWGDRSQVEVIANPGKNTDPAAVVFDAITAAHARNTELLLIDTAGRLQNKKNLMDELAKVRRIIDKKAPDANVESLLVLDATLGQNGLRQAEVFAEAAQISGVVLTKLDGTAKGGIALAVVQQLGLPIRFIGAGEGIEDLRPFSSYEFIEALLSG